MPNSREIRKKIKMITLIYYNGLEWKKLNVETKGKYQKKTNTIKNKNSINF